MFLANQLLFTKEQSNYSYVINCCIVALWERGALLSIRWICSESWSWRSWSLFDSDLRWPIAKHPKKVWHCFRKLLYKNISYIKSLQLDTSRMAWSDLHRLPAWYRYNKKLSNHLYRMLDFASMSLKVSWEIKATPLGQLSSKGRQTFHQIG